MGKKFGIFIFKNAFPVDSGVIKVFGGWFFLLIIEKVYDLTCVILGKKCVVLLFLSSKKCIFAAQIFKLQDFQSDEV